MNKHISVILVVAALALASTVAHAHTFQIDTLIDAERGGANDVSVGPDNLSMAYDSLGNLGMCYHDVTHNDLKFALYDGHAWTFETVHADPNGDNVGMYCALVFDDDDKPNIVYFNVTDRAVLHAIKNGAQWAIGTVDAPVGVDMFGLNRLSIAKDGIGDLGIAYYDGIGRDLKYAKYSNNRWVVSVVRNAGDVGRYAALDFDSRNRPVIAYQEYTDNATAALKLIAHTGNAWGVPETVDGTDNAGSYLAFKLDANDKPHLIYRHYITAQQFYRVFYINKVTGAWSERYPLVQEMGPATGFYCQMAIDTLGNVHMVYMDQFVSALFPDVNYLKMTSLHFASRGAEFTSQIDSRLAASVAPMVDYVGMAIAVDPNFNLMLAWAQESDRNYDLVTAKLTAWSPVVVLTTPNANNHSAQDTFNVEWIDFDPDSNATIRFKRMDANWESVTFPETALENNDDRVVINTSQVPHGEYTLIAEASDDDFAMYSGSWGRVRLTVQNHVPSAPNPTGPADRASVDTATPTLQWAASSDVDGDAMGYQVQVATDNAFANIVASGNNVANAQWAPADALGNNATYHWRVRAVDSEGGNSQWAASRQFSTNVAVAPVDVGNNAPANNAPPAGGGNNAGNNAGQAPAGGGNAPANAGAGNNAGNNAGQAPAGANAGPAIGGGNAPVDAGGGAGQSAGGAASGASSGAASSSSGGSGSGSGSAAGNAAAAAGAPSGGGCSLIR